MRILRPWLVASASGLAIGVVLLQFSADPNADLGDNYTEIAPRAAVYDYRPEAQPSTDPSDSASLLVPSPDEPWPGAIESAMPPQVSSLTTDEIFAP
jgi:hypothetical protein